jgi:glycosyltransferase involved in cell wall biosynthesis
MTSSYKLFLHRSLITAEQKERYMLTPLKVMQLVLSLVIGGTEKLVYDLVRHIDKHVVSPVVCCLDKFGDFGEELQREGYQVYTLNRKPGIDWGLISRLSAIVRQEQIDIIHAQQYTPYFYGLMASLSSKLSISTKSPKLIFTEHGIPYPYRKKMKRLILNPVLCLFADEIITISEYTKSNLIKYENFPARRMKIVYNGVDLGQFSQEIDPAAKKQFLRLPHDSKVIGIVARLDPVKNHAMLFRAFKKVLNSIPETYLLIVGEGAEENKLKALTESLGISDKTVFLGARKDIPELLHIFDVFALPSLSEGMSVTLIEAMGAGVPVVATRVGGNPEVVKDQETGYLVESDNDQEMADMLIKLLQDNEARQRMRQAGQQRAHDIFSLDKMVNTYTELYFKVSNPYS